MPLQPYLSIEIDPKKMPSSIVGCVINLPLPPNNTSLPQYPGPSINSMVIQHDDDIGCVAGTSQGHKLARGLFFSDGNGLVGERRSVVWPTSFSQLFLSLSVSWWPSLFLVNKMKPNIQKQASHQWKDKINGTVSRKSIEHITGH